MINVGRARWLLGAIMAGLSVGVGFLLASTLPWGAQAAIGGFAALLFVSAATVLAMTFMVLDEHGRIPEGTLYHQYLSSFKDFFDGEKMPDFLGVCPVFWLTVFGIAAFLVLLGVLALCVALVVAVVIRLVEVSSTHPFDVLIWTGVSLGGAFLVGLAGYGLYELARQHKIVRDILTGVLIVGIIGSCVAVIVGLVFVTTVLPVENRVVQHDESVGHAAVFVAGWWLIGIASLVGVLALIAGLIAAAIRIFPWFKNTALAQLLIAWYHKACPSFGIEQTLRQEKTVELQPEFGVKEVRTIRVPSSHKKIALGVVLLGVVAAAALFLKKRAAS